MLYSINTTSVSNNSLYNILLALISLLLSANTVTANETNCKEKGGEFIQSADGGKCFCPSEKGTLDLPKFGHGFWLDKNNQTCLETVEELLKKINKAEMALKNSTISMQYCEEGKYSVNAASTSSLDSSSEVIEDSAVHKAIVDFLMKNGLTGNIEIEEEALKRTNEFDRINSADLQFLSSLVEEKIQTQDNKRLKQESHSNWKSSYGSQDIFKEQKKLTNTVVAKLVKHGWPYQKILSYLHLQRYITAELQGMRDAKDFGKKLSGTLYTPLDGDRFKNFNRDFVVAFYGDEYQGTETKLSETMMLCMKLGKIHVFLTENHMTTIVRPDPKLNYNDPCAAEFRHPTDIGKLMKGKAIHVSLSRAQELTEQAEKLYNELIADPTWTKGIHATDKEKGVLIRKIAEISWLQEHGVRILRGGGAIPELLTDSLLQIIGLKRSQSDLWGDAILRSRSHFIENFAQQVERVD